jgi:Protein of unknown function (DUF742)
LNRDDEWYDDDAGPVVRPYAVTGGRTRPTSGVLDLVTLVSTTSRGRSAMAMLDPEQQAIAALCQTFQSVAEVSARLKIPIGVARILVGDMIDAGLVNVRRPDRPTQRPAASLMEIVLDGLRTL